MNRRFCSLIAATVLATAFAAVGQTDDARIEKGITLPSSRKEITFANTGIIARVDVKEGDVVKTGQLLMEQDSRIELKRLETLKLEADRAALIKAREASLANKKVVLKRVSDLYAKKAVSESEVQTAELEVALAEAELELAKQETKVKVAELGTQEVRVDQMLLRAPSDGIIAEIKLTEGEVAGIDRPAVVMVKNDPLYIEVKTLPTDVVAKLRTGQELDVRYEQGKWQKAKINFIAPQADARAKMQSIRLEMPNPEGRWSGLDMEVRIPEGPSQTVSSRE